MNAAPQGHRILDARVVRTSTLRDLFPNLSDRRITLLARRVGRDGLGPAAAETARRLRWNAAQRALLAARLIDLEEGELVADIDTRSRVYFVRAGDHGFIKVGVAVDVAARIRELQTGNPTKLVLLGTIVGDRSLEAAIHRRFRDSRVRGEWFMGLAGMQRFIAEHAEVPR